jgi:hypothetical protein
MVIFFQIFTFSCAVGYLIATIESWGYSKKCLLLAGGFIVLNPSTHGIMMYAWKDTALTIITTFLSAYIINIFLSEGKWFSKIKNIAVFAFCTGLATIVRHNGMFFTIPLMFLSFVLYIKKEPRVIFGILTTALIIFSIRFPIYSVLKVTYPDNVYVESVGIPMTIMGDVLIKNPAALSPETKDFLYKIASDEEWRTEYKTGNYNTIKYNDNERSNSVIRDTPVEKFFKMTIDTIKSDTRNSFHAFRDVTAIVWEVFGSPRVISVPNRDSFMEEQNIIRKAVKICLYGFEQLIACIPPLAWIMTKTGWQMLALLLVGIVSCYRNGGKTLFLIIPLVMYNLGTMLLLCSEDVRFFHFNAVVLPAFVLALLGKNDTVRGGTA